MAKRRANGEGSIYKRTDGRWVAALVLPGGQRKAYYGTTRADVAQKLTRGLQALQAGRPIPSEQLKVGTYLQEWLQSVQPSLRPRTWTRYEQLLRCHVLPTLGQLPFARLDPRHLQQHYAALLAQGLAPATVRQLHAILHHAVRQAERWGLVARNVVALVIPPRVPRYDVTPLSAEHTRAVLAAATGTRDAALYALALSSGMRQGELLALRWEDVDLEARTVQVRHTLTQTSRGWTLSEPKTARARRRIALTPSAATALRTHKRRQAERRLRAGEAWADHGLVFATAHGQPLDAGNVRRAFWALLRRAGLPRRRFHDLRHTAATLLLQRGIHPKVVSELLGHSSIGLTLDVYSHVVPDMQEQAAQTMEQLLTQDQRA